MKVILLQELKGKGGEGDVVDVAPGFANNYLLPQKVAILATKGNLKQLEQRKHKRTALPTPARSRKRSTARSSRSKPRWAKRVSCSVPLPLR